MIQTRAIQGTRLEVLGGFRLLTDEREQRLPSRHARAVLAFLALQNDRAVERSKLCGLIWPDEPESRARRSLSQALWRAKEIVPQVDRSLEADADRVRLIVNPSDPRAFLVDAARFQAALEGHAPDWDDRLLETHREALALYRGELLEGWADEWVLEERQRLHGLYVRALEGVARALEARTDLDGALEVAHKWVNSDSLNEDAHRLVMRLAASLGRTAQALEQYERLGVTLRSELGTQSAEPDARTRALRQRLVRHAHADPAHAPRASVTEASLIGRERERARLIAALERSRAGGTLVLLEGQSGIGKTRLLRELSADAAWRDVDVLWAQGLEFTRTEPFAALRHALEAHLTPARTARLAQRLEAVWINAAAGLVPNLAVASRSAQATVAPQDEPIRAQEGLRHVIKGLAATGPCVLVVDDLQWVDEGTLRVLERLTRHTPRGLTVIVAYRPSEARDRTAVWETLQALSAADGCERLKLEALSPEAAARLARASLNLGDDLTALDLIVPDANALAERLARDTNGHPLYLLETLRALIERGALRHEDGDWHSDFTADASLPVSDGVRTVIVARLSQLASGARTMIGVIALIGEPVAPEVLMEITLLGRAGLEALELLERRGWLEVHGEMYRVMHDLVRTTVSEELELHERRAHHAAIARVLGQREPERAAVIAYHHQAAEQWAQAAAHLVRAAEDAIRLHDYRSARTVLDRALDAPMRETLEPEILIEALELHWRASQVSGDLEAQERDLDALEELTRTDPPRAAHFEYKRAEVLSKRGQFQAAAELATAVRDAALERGQMEVVAQATSSLRMIFSDHGQHEQAIAHGLQAAQFFHDLGDEKAGALALMNLAGDEMYLGRADDAFDRLQIALQSFERLEHRLGVAGALGSLAIIEDSRNHRERSRQLQLQALETYRTIGSMTGAGRCLFNLAWMAVDRNHLAEALRLHRQALEVFLTTETTNLEMHTRRSLTGLLVIQLGRWEEADAQLGITSAYFERTNNARGRWYNLDARQRIATQRGQIKKALGLVEQMHQIALDANDAPCEVMARWSQARLQAQRGDEGALEAFAGIKPDLEQFGMLGLTAEFDTHLAKAYLNAGQAQAALELIDPSLNASQGTDDEPRLVPDLHHLRARALRQLGRNAEAEHALDRAYRELQEAFEGLGKPDRDLALSRVPEWRDLAHDWESRRLRRVTTHWPNAGEPGMSLAVQLTLESPKDLGVAGKTSRRRLQLERVLREATEQGSAPRIADLAALFGLSLATLKRDLAALRDTKTLAPDA